MVKAFDKDGVSFSYPDNWTLELDEGDGGWTASLHSKETAFLLVTLDRSLPEPRDMVQTAMDALRSEYPTLEADAAVDLLAGEMAVGHDIQFFSLDLSNTCWTRSLYCGAGTLLVYWQANDLELLATESVLRAVCASLRVEE